MAKGSYCQTREEAECTNQAIKVITKGNQMYMIDSWVDTAINRMGVKWKSDDHRTVAVNMCIGNPDIRTMDQLKDMVGAIQSVSVDECAICHGSSVV